MSYESVLCVIRECFVYKIPPRSSATGYRAGDWDVNQFLFTGRLRIIAVGDNCALHLEDPNTGELFAKAPVEKDGTGIEAVTDSSRYFVIRVVDPGSGQKAYVGLGFQERSYAFDVNVAIQDHLKRLNNEPQSHQVLAQAAAAAPVIDYSWKEGQKISISLGNSSSSSSKKPSSSIEESGNSDFSKFFIAPPPSSKSDPWTAASSGSNVNSKPANTTASSTADDVKWDDDFGDFNSTQIPAPTTSTSYNATNNKWTSF